ncbi:LuxR C-terminal-related transcriptional regulator [Catellatospora sp. TT07R-123]|uniref:LuxR C-terminal-related transcriptional regulator n=1 Tax=Catellatospora sp. TT07R-123 TaxID=2733863 RepID=UPI001BB3DC02|nr:helix-turn-helix transcriptional regulator [Catellatospora sp. TT07R-123]
MIGRRPQLALIGRELAQPPALVLVTGPAGVGRTSLLDEAARACRGAVLRTRCHRGADPLGPVADALAACGSLLPAAKLLSPATGVLSGLVPELGPLLPPPPGGDVAPHQLLRAVRSLLGALGTATLVVDDAQHLDPLTARLLRSLVGEPLPGLGLLLSFRGRSAEVRALAADATRTRVTEIELDPLTPAETHALVVSVVRRDVSAVLADDLAARTGGLPLLVTGLARVMRERPRSWDVPADRARHELDGLPVPTGLYDRLLADRPLSAPALRVLRAAAVLGDVSDDELLSATARLPLPLTAAAAAECAAAGLLRDDGPVTVAPELLRRAVYESVSPAERRMLHRSAVKALDRTDPRPLDRLAAHARLAGLPGWWRYLEAAADQAAERGDAPNAARMLREALSAPAPAPDTARLARKLAVAALDGLAHQDTVALLTGVLDGPELPAATRGELRLHLGLLLVNQLGRIAAGRREIRAALPDLDAAPALRARALSALAVPMWPQDTVDQHLSWLAQADEAAAEDGGAPGVAAVRVNRVTALLNTGDPSAREQLRALAHPGRTGAETAQLARGACSHADAAGWLGHYRLADDLLQRAEVLARRSAPGFADSITAVTRLRLDWCCGRWQGLADRAETLRSGPAALPPVVREARLVLGLVRLAQGDVGTAAEQLGAAGRWHDPDTAVPVTVAAAAGLARLQLDRGDHRAALGTAEQAIELVRGKRNGVWLADAVPVAVEAYLACGDVAGAARLTAELAAGLAGRDAPLAAAALAAGEARMLAAAGRTAAAVAAHHRAARHYAALPQPYAVARELAAAGRCLLDTDRDRGGHLVQAALARFERLGATRDAGHCRMTLRAHGFAVTHRRGRRGYGDDLSPREAEVARLAATGLSNRDIARALYLSERTVEDHVARAMRKTGATSRHGLAPEVPGRRDPVPAR